MQGQRGGGRLLAPVLLCDVVQLLLVDVNVVPGGDRRLSAPVVHLEVRVTGRDRHHRGMKANVCGNTRRCSELKTPGLSLSFAATAAAAASQNTLPLFRLPTSDVSASPSRNVAIGPSQRCEARPRRLTLTVIRGTGNWRRLRPFSRRFFGDARRLRSDEWVLQR